MSSGSNTDQPMPVVGGCYAHCIDVCTANHLTKVAILGNRAVTVFPLNHPHGLSPVFGFKIAHGDDLDIVVLEKTAEQAAALPSGSDERHGDSV